MIILYKGRRGAGKTLTMTKDAYNFYVHGWRIYSNIEFNFPHEYINEDDIISIDENSTINNCVLVIDEIQILLDSRRSGKGRNVDFSHFIQQIRKRNIIVLCTTQFTSTVDLRLRQHVDVVAKPRFNKEYQVCEVTYLDITALEEFDALIEEDDSPPPAVTTAFDARQVYPLYDTFKIVKVKEKKKVEKPRKRFINNK